jgi:glycosyltransferase involved in cell wall biosynthesis
MRRIYPNLAHKKISVIYNGINFDKFNKIIDSQSEKDLSIIFYGRLTWIKGILHLIKSVALLKGEFPELRLKVCGRGPLEGRIQVLIRKLKLKENVFVLGHLPHNNLMKEIIESSIVVLPSLYEVGPFISGLEAMACKKPLICFDLPFTREFILNMHNGVLAKANDVKDLSDKIYLLLSDTDLRRKLGKNAYEYVISKHNWDLLVKKYLDIYENCISR